MSYVKDYYSGDQKVDDFFCDGATNFDTEIADLNKKIAKTKASLEDTINERNNLYTKMYKGKAVEEYDKRHKRLDPFSVMYYETLVPLKNATKDMFTDERHRKDILNYFYDSEDRLDESYADFGFNEPEF